MKTYANIYYRARMQAAQREPLHASRERTASEIFVSCEALADYETGRTVPPCDVVQKMVEAYNDPDLKAAHIRACCPLLPDYGGEGCSELARAALGWAIAFQSAQDIALQFATVARDGRITQDELPAAQTISGRQRRLCRAEARPARLGRCEEPARGRRDARRVIEGRRPFLSMRRAISALRTLFLLLFGKNTSIVGMKTSPSHKHLLDAKRK